LREKKRYLVFEVQAKHAFNLDEVRRAVNTALLQFIGELGYAKAGVMVMDDWKNNKGIMKINNKHVDDVKSGLALIGKIGNETVIVKTIGVSGILKKARGKFL